MKKIENNSKKTGRRNFVASSTVGVAAMFLPSETKSQDDKFKPAELSPPKFPPLSDPVNVNTQDVQVKTLLVNSPNFLRKPQEQESWEIIKSRITSDFCSILDEMTSGNLATFSKRIESGFKFQPEALDTDFSPLHVEPLIDQAADLLDRGLRDRAAWDDMAVKLFDLAVELCTYKELDAIHIEEEAAHIYDTPADQSEAEWVAEHVAVQRQQHTVDLMHDILKDYYTPEKAQALWLALLRAAELVGVAPYRVKDQDTLPLSYTIQGQATSVSGHSVIAAGVTATHQVNTERLLVDINNNILETQTMVSARRSEGLKSKMDWDKKNADFMRRRTLVSRKYQDMRAKAATELDGILHYQKRLDPLKESFHSDFRDAYARLIVVQKGLNDLYGYEAPLPKDKDAIDYFDRCRLWTRASVQWLIRFSRQDQNLVIPVSLKQIMPKGAYSEAKQRGRWEFDLGDNCFAGLKHVRIRGLSAFVSGDIAKEKTWYFVVNVPKSAIVNHLRGKNVTINQSQVPPCRLARVTGRNAQREPDIVGLSALYNASPIGRWIVQTASVAAQSPPPQIPPVEPVMELDDIYLDIHLAYRDPMGG